MEKKARLGRGVDALFPNLNGEENVPLADLAQVAVETIDQNPHQPRRAFDDEELVGLGESIKSIGVLQPLVVRQVGERFQLVAGERRLRAARAAGLTTVPVRVINLNEQQSFEATLVENIQRTDLNPIEKAQGFQEYLQRFQITHEELAKKLGLARVTITNLVGLLDLPGEVQDEIRRGQLTQGHAKLLKGITDRELQVALAKEIIARGLSVHAAEAFLRQSQQPKPDQEKTAEKKPEVQKTNHVLGIEDELRQRFMTRVEIKLSAKDRGQIVLTFETSDDFERLLEVLRR